MAQINLQDVPKKDDPQYFDTVLANCITAYRRFLSDSMSLDYCGITGKQRALILDNKDYKRMTRTIRAEKYLDEIDEVEELSQALRGAEPDEGDEDIREANDPEKEYNKQYKDWFAMKMKAAEMRRDLLKMTKADDEKEEADALNIFFVALTKEEFAAIKEHEVFEGFESDDDPFADGEKAKPVVASAKTMLYDNTKDEVLGGYKINSDGTVEDW